MYCLIPFSRFCTGILICLIPVSLLFADQTFDYSQLPPPPNSHLKHKKPKYLDNHLIYFNSPKPTQPLPNLFEQQPKIVKPIFRPLD